MDHIAIMDKQWGMLPKILSGEKIIESRWYQTKRAPWGKIVAGDKVYFKNSGELVTTMATVAEVQQRDNLTSGLVHDLLKTYGADLGIESSQIPYFYNQFKDKKYCVLIFLKNPRKIKPFAISKRGFGAMAAWITLPSHRLSGSS